VIEIRRGVLGACLVLAFGAGAAVFGYGAYRAAAPLPARAAPPVVSPAAAPEGLPSFRQAAAAVGPAVINVNTVTVVRDPLSTPRSPMEEFFGEEFFRRFFGGPRERRQHSLGSGVIVDPTGIALTNAHVIERASQVEVVTADGKKHPAQVVGADGRADLAVLRITGGSSFVAARLGDSDRLEVGDWVLAIGSPFGFAQTVTAGIVSAKGRMLGQGPFDDFLQTDAAINPGNSGGPLVNLAGEVVGINTAIASRSGGSMGVGFAIPINVAKRVYTELTTHGKVARGWLGISVQPLTAELAQSFGAASEAGILVADVIEKSPADRGGLRAGDIILEFNGKAVTGPADLQRGVALAGPGSRVSLRVWRERAPRTVEITLEEPPADERAPAPSGPRGNLLGLEVSPLTPEAARRLGVRVERGVVVTAVRAGSPAETGGIQAGDVVLDLNRQAVHTLADFERTVNGVRAGDRVTLRLLRGQAALYVAFTVKAN
jgi:serine protease Do